LGVSSSPAEFFQFLNVFLQRLLALLYLLSDVGQMDFADSGDGQFIAELGRQGKVIFGGVE
jgi:hypothetical protein